MQRSHERISEAVGPAVQGRYRFLHRLGQGGMAEVHAVHDELRSRRVALKRLVPRATQCEQQASQFQREYLTLKQLAHPAIIRVYDFGYDARIPYYTMEIVDGSDLRAAGPLPWRDVCALLRDVASALAFLHARRLVHRDVTPANVHRTSDGRAKLLDFGALAPMGPSRHLVGTPPFAAPEGVRGDPLDGRSDLFSLGALAYYLLTGRHAFPARRFIDLEAVWAHPVSAPSERADGVPTTLDELVLALLGVDPASRPMHAAEVFDRLTSIANLEPAEAPEVARAYVTTPALVGRDRVLDRFWSKLGRAQLGAGGAVLLEGPPGIGRSRLLTHLSMQASLRGATVLTASREQFDGERPFGAIDALLGSIADVLPDEVRNDPDRYPILNQTHGGLFRGDSATPAPDVTDTARQQEIVRFVSDLTSRAPVVIACDDVDSYDPSSVGVLGQLLDRATRLPLLLLASASTEEQRRGAATGARLFSRMASVFRLQPLEPSETRSLFASIFGAAPNLDSLSTWAHALAQGNPRMTIELAQHLVDRDLASYADGIWTLPASMDQLGLPKRIDEVLDARVLGLSSLATRLARSLALATPHEPLRLAEYGRLFSDVRPEALFEAFFELVSAGILSREGDGYAFVHRDMAAAVCRTISPDRLPGLHRAIAGAFAAGDAPCDLAAAYHFDQAGHPELAYDHTLAWTDEGARARGITLLRSAEGVALFEKLFEWGEATKRPRVAQMRFLRTLVTLASMKDERLGEYGPIALERLKHDTGLVYLPEAAPDATPLERVHACLGRAYAAYHATPESERGLDPPAAVHELAVVSAMLLGVYSRQYDTDAIAELSDIVEPLRPLAPAIAVICDLVMYSLRAMQGGDIRAERVALLDHLSQPVPGIEDPFREGIVLTNLYYLALDDAIDGLDSAEHLLDPLESVAQYAPLAWHGRKIRLLARGYEEEALECERKGELATTGRQDIDRFLEIGTLYEAWVYRLLGNVLGIKRLLPSLAERATRGTNLETYYHIVHGDYLSLLGDAPGACASYERAVKLARGIAHHPSYVDAVVQWANALVESAEAPRAEDVARKALEECQGQPMRNRWLETLEMTLAFAECHTGKGEQALERAQAALARAEARGVGGVVLVHHLAALARVALKVGAHAVFESAAQRMGDLCARVNNPGFTGRYAALMRSAIHARSTPGFAAVPASRSAFDRGEEIHTSLGATVRTELELCRGPVERANRALNLIMSQCAVDVGHLFVCREHGVELVASVGTEGPPQTLETQVREWVAEWNSLNDVTTDQTEAGPPTTERSFLALSAICVNRGGERLLAGVVALASGCDRSWTLDWRLSSAIAEGLVDAADAVPMTSG